MEQISGKHAFVTGGASGLGLAIARRLAAEGAKLTIADFDKERLAGLRDPFLALEMDVRELAAWKRAKSKAEARNGPVAILINNAGIGPQLRELADMAPAVFERMIAIKLTGSFYGVHCFAAGMRERGDGHIVNTCSMAALHSRPLLGEYGSAKMGLLGMSEMLREELAPHGVGVSAFCPGMIATELAATTAKVEGRWDEAMERQAMPGADPAKAAERVVEGVKGNWPYILTHGENRAPVEARMRAIIEAFKATPDSASL